ncbi:D-allose transport system permease protein AlsC [Phycisphaerae bacterium RAS1]|nr:D-allose transport system permease protein AlsC [Phycisphaerae bacterium RAS1]
MALWSTPWRLQEAGLILVIVLIGLLLTLGGEPVTIKGVTMNNFLRADNIIANIATPMSWIAIMAIGVTFVIAAGGIDISVGSIFGLAALGTAAVLQNFAEHASAWQVLPIALLTPLAIGGLCGLINGMLVVGLRMHPFIVTLGTLSIFRGIALVSVPTKSLPASDKTLPLAFTRQFMSWQVEFQRGDLPMLLLQPMPMIVMLLLLVVAWVFLGHTVPGREIYAIGGNEEAARFSGLPIRRIKLRVYLLSGLCAGLAAMVSTGYFGSANTATGEGYELMVIAAAVVGGASLSGGRGTALGAVLGALVIKLIENGIFILKEINFGVGKLTLSKEYSKIIIGIAIVLAVAVDRFSEYLQQRRMSSAGAKKM